MQNGQSVLRKSLPLLIILGLALGGAALLVVTKPQSHTTESEEKVWVVTTQNAVLTQHTPVISLYGRIESTHVSRLTSALNTDVLAVLGYEGEHVTKGQILVQLDDRNAQLRHKQRMAEQEEIRAQLSSEQNRIVSDRRILKNERQLQALAQQAVERAQRLKKDKLTAQSFIDEAQQLKLRQDIVVAQRQFAVDDHQARLHRLQALLKKAESLQALAALDVDRTKITAPFNARITQLPASPGNHTRPGDVLVELYALDALQVRAQIPNAKLAAIETALTQGQNLTALARTSTQQTVNLTLSHLAGDIKTKRGGRDALFTLDGTNPELPIGSIITLQLSLPPVEESLALPREALYDGNRIYSIVNGRLKSHHAERLGETSVTNTHMGTNPLLIRSASITPGDIIVTTQLPNAIEGLKVRVHQPTHNLSANNSLIDQPSSNHE